MSAQRATVPVVCKHATTAAVLFAFFLLFTRIGWTQPYIISTIAGSPRLLDGGSATSAPLRSPLAVAVDGAGNLYIADAADNRIRRVSSSGIISTYAGTGIGGYSGDRAPATTAELNNPTSIALDSKGNLYIADSLNFVVRRVSTDGTINTVAGSGTPGFSGDGGPVLSARMAPLAITVDGLGNLYIADSFNYRIRKVDASGKITTIAGTGSRGSTGNNGPAILALLDLIVSLAVDSSGNLYLADVFNGYIRKIDASGMITVIAGSGSLGYIDDGIPATSAVMTPNGLALDSSGSLYLSDANFFHTVVQRVDLSTGLIYTVAGTGTVGFLGDGGVATAAELNNPTGLAVNSNNDVYVADNSNGRVRKISKTLITTVAGTSIRDGEPATSAFLNFPEGIGLDATGNLLVADRGNFSARRFKLGGNINTFGQLQAPPNGVTADQAGNFYVTDDEPRVLKIEPDGTTAIIAGNGQAGFGGDDGPAMSAMLAGPAGVAIDSAKNIYIADFGNNRVRKVDATGNIKTIAGNGKPVYSGDGAPALSAGLTPYDLALDASGDLFIADSLNSRVRKITPDGNITTVAGSGLPGYAGDGGPATAARLNFPAGIALDRAGNLYIADNGNGVVRRVTSGGLITTIAGSGTSSPNAANSGPATAERFHPKVSDSAGDGGPATAAHLDPRRIAVDSAGNLYVTDSFNDRVRMLTPQAIAPAALDIVSGNNQSATVGTSLAAPLVLKVTDGTGTGLGGVVVSFTVNPASGATVSPAPAITLNDGTVSATVTLGNTAGALTIDATAFGVAGKASFSLTAVASNAPSISAGGITSAGLSNPAVQALSSNAIASIFGTKFAADGTARKVGPGDLVDGRIPTNLAGVCAEFGGIRAPVFAVYPGQLNVQVPTLPTGNTAVEVITNCDTPQAVASPPIAASVQSAAPEFFYFVHNANGNNPIAAVNAVTGAYIGTPGLIAGASFTPAQPDDILTLYATGFGATDPPFGPGDLPDKQAQVTAPVTITLGGVTLAAFDILYVGVTQDAGLYQVNLKVPKGLPDGDQPLVITIGGVASPSNAFITVKKSAGS